MENNEQNQISIEAETNLLTNGLVHYCVFMGWEMGGTICHYRVVQQDETGVCHHKSKYFVLEPIVAFVAIWREIIEFKE